MAYLGTQPNDVKKNTGLYTPSEILQLTKDGSWGGSLQLIEEQVVSGSPTTIDFINLENNPFEVYLVHIIDLVTTSQSQITYRFSNDNGATFEAGSTAYEYAGVRVISSGSFNDPRSAGSSSIQTDAYTNTSTSSFNSFVYLYNLLDSSKFSNLNQHSTTNLAGNFRMTYGGGVYQTAETINGFRILTGTLTSGSAKLYGIKEI